MDYITLAISIVSMVAGVISAIVAVKAKNESKKILIKIENISANFEMHSHKNEGSSTENSGDILVENSGKNEGVVAGIVSGGVGKSGRKKR